MAITKFGDIVKIHYTGRLEDGDTFVSTAEQKPVEFKVGKGEVIPGLEKAVVGMKPGETKEAKLPPREAFGNKRDELIMAIDRERIPETIDPVTGKQLVVNYKENQSVIFTVTEVTDSEIKLDANHPLAGKEVIIDVELLEITKN